MKYIKFVTNLAELIRYDLRMEWIVLPIRNEMNNLIGWFVVDSDANDRLVYRELLRTGLSKMQSTIIIQMINHAKDWDDDDDAREDDLNIIHSTVSTILRKKF